MSFPDVKKRKTESSSSVVQDSVNFTGKWFFINIVEPDYRSYWATGIPEALYKLFQAIHGCTGVADVLWEEGQRADQPANKQTAKVDDKQTDKVCITVDDALELLGSDVGQYVREDGINYEADECESLNALLNKLQAYTAAQGGEYHKDALTSMTSGLAYSDEVLEAVMGDRFIFYRGELQILGM